ncbi:unnamed protein product [Acanthoscelides obtectus]|uniref:DDE Tnp4 domain-containing protein n=1 Tax=Acanthoscelides obtectus TaxID=200917 RepID=A0A9P0K1W3_ACAOB|nr:unnamed protein product [Acanthoscelides obtectus]CAK1665935.1 hypothetical protein AOBTE_LOCUS25058 [Acanthoscelides obtectus]
MDLLVNEAMLEDGLPRCSTPTRRSMYQPRPNFSSASDNEGYSRFRCRLDLGGVAPRLRGSPCAIPGVLSGLIRNYLAEGCSMQQLAWDYYVGKSTVHYIIKDTCKVIWTHLQPIVLQQPNQEQWQTIVEEFTAKWHMPNCLGALDDQAFPLSSHIMRPVAGQALPEAETIFNYRLSRARRVIENAFGILALRWRILRSTIIADIDTCEEIVKATIVLHNYLQASEAEIPAKERRYCPTGFVDYEVGGQVQGGAWRQESVAMSSVGRQAQNNAARASTALRKALMQYLVSDVGAVPWQWDSISLGAVPT